MNRIKCLFKGHRFIMNYYINYKRYYPRNNDRCECCNKLRG